MHRSSMKPAHPQVIWGRQKRKSKESNNFDPLLHGTIAHLKQSGVSPAGLFQGRFWLDCGAQSHIPRATVEWVGPQARHLTKAVALESA